ncbi:MAG: DUF4175 domain-containing protein [Terricaulis sp.]|nr:DUF4175 domain-containing protein [Terricaulis sp.]
MLREVERLAEQGRHAEAQQLLDQLTNILANMDVRLTESQQAGEGGEGESDQAMQESMDQLSQTMGEQRALNNETQQQDAQQQQQQAQGGAGGEQQGGMGGDELAERQAQIRQGLTEAQRMADDAGATPNQSLTDANRAMGQAEDALRRGDLEGAQAAQQTAMDQMREGAETLASDMRRQGQGEREGQRGEGDQPGNRDPLGRFDRRRRWRRRFLPRPLRSRARARNLRPNPPPRPGRRTPRGRARLSAPVAGSLRRQLNSRLSGIGAA